MAGWLAAGVVCLMQSRMSSVERTRSSERRYIMWPLDPSGKMKDRLRFEGYRSGHMMYLRSEDLASANEDLRDFIRQATPAPNAPAKY